MTLPTILGILLLVVAAFGLVRGKVLGGASRNYSRTGNPIAFWSITLATAALGLIFLLRF